MVARKTFSSRKKKSKDKGYDFALITIIVSRLEGCSNVEACR